MGWDVSEWVGLGKFLCGRGRVFWFVFGFLFVFFVMCMGELIIFLIVIIDFD